MLWSWPTRIAFPLFWPYRPSSRFPRARTTKPTTTIQRARGERTGMVTRSEIQANRSDDNGNPESNLLGGAEFHNYSPIFF